MVKNYIGFVTLQLPECKKDSHSGQGENPESSPLFQSAQTLDAIDKPFTLPKM